MTRRHNPEVETLTSDYFNSSYRASSRLLDTRHSAQQDVVRLRSRCGVYEGIAFREKSVIVTALFSFWRDGYRK